MAIRNCSMENMDISGFWKAKKVLITGHTGFKGSWLSLWLHKLGADVTGFSLNPPTKPSLFELSRIDRKIKSILGDVRNLAYLERVLNEFNPEIVIHMDHNLRIKLIQDTLQISQV